MKFHRRNAPLILILLPLTAALSAATQDNIASTLASKDTGSGYSTQADSTLVSLGDSLKAKHDVGTKDAPVDGKDGKPHAGPFVGSEKDSKQSKTGSDGSEGAKQKGSTSDSVATDAGKILTANDGVMNDPSRALPREGTTGTEGGVSEKSKAEKAEQSYTGGKAEKVPEPPKEVLPPPLSEEVRDVKPAKPKAKGPEDEDDVEDEGLAGLEKPHNLPEKANNLPNPLPNSAQKDHLDITKTKTSSKAVAQGNENDGLIQPFHSFVLSLTMILFSEIGDKTFLIAALMAMKHDRMIVFSAAFSALISMTILSAVLGHAVPTLIPKKFTNFLASGLFLIFGARMLREGLAMSKHEGVAAEMQEVEMELEEKEQQIRQQRRRKFSISPYALEMGLDRKNSRTSRSATRLPSPPRSPSSSPDRSPSPSRSTLRSSLGGLNNLFSLLLSPAWVQTFVMTFLGEWGDRSQIATIAMAAGQDYWWVTGGAVSGHAVCTGVAVIGGRAIAGKVSLRVVTLGGAGAFLVFGVIYLVEALSYG